MWPLVCVHDHNLFVLFPLAVGCRSPTWSRPSPSTRTRARPTPWPRSRRTSTTPKSFLCVFFLKIRIRSQTFSGHTAFNRQPPPPPAQFSPIEGKDEEMSSGFVSAAVYWGLEERVRVALEREKQLGWFASSFLCRISLLLSEGKIQSEEKVIGVRIFAFHNCVAKFCCMYSLKVPHPSLSIYRCLYLNAAHSF